MPARVVSILTLLTALTTLSAESAAQSVPAAARSTEPIAYTVSFPQPHTHYAEIVAIVPTSGRPAIEMMMAVWTPGSYLVREFERHLLQEAYVIPTIWWHRIVVHHKKLKGWHITPSHYVGQDLTNVWLDQ